MQLTMNNLGYECNDEFLFRKINRTLVAGQCLEIRGSNGSGKSTLLRILAGLLQPTEGSVCFQGHPVYIGHKNSLRSNLTVYENLYYYCALMQHQHLDLKKALQHMGLSHYADRQTAQLSAGQLRRLCLVKLLLQPAALWLLDEPTTALDSEGQVLLFDLIEKQLQQNGIIIIATHQAIPYSQQTMQLGENQVV